MRTSVPERRERRQYVVGKRKEDEDAPSGRGSCMRVSRNSSSPPDWVNWAARNCWGMSRVVIVVVLLKRRVKLVKLKAEMVGECEEGGREREVSGRPPLVGG